jgi:hypothetical protein
VSLTVSLAFPYGAQIDGGYRVGFFASMGDAQRAVNIATAARAAGASNFGAQLAVARAFVAAASVVVA